MNYQAWLVLVLAMEGVILISLCTLFYQLLRQQGRFLLRLDDLEQSLTRGLAVEADPRNWCRQDWASVRHFLPSASPILPATP